MHGKKQWRCAMQVFELYGVVSERFFDALVEPSHRCHRKHRRRSEVASLLIGTPRKTLIWLHSGGHALLIVDPLRPGRLAHWSLHLAKMVSTEVVHITLTTQCLAFDKSQELARTGCHK